MAEIIQKQGSSPRWVWRLIYIALTVVGLYLTFRPFLSPYYDTAQLLLNLIFTGKNWIYFFLGIIVISMTAIQFRYRRHPVVVLQHIETVKITDGGNKATVEKEILFQPNWLRINAWKESISSDGKITGLDCEVLGILKTSQSVIKLEQSITPHQMDIFHVFPPLKKTFFLPIPANVIKFIGLGGYIRKMRIEHEGAYLKKNEYHELRILNRPHKKIIFTVILPYEPINCRAWRLQENTGRELTFSGPSKTDKGWEITTSNAGWIYGEIYRIEWEKK